MNVYGPPGPHLSLKFAKESRSVVCDSAVLAVLFQMLFGGFLSKTLQAYGESGAPRCYTSGS